MKQQKDKSCSLTGKSTHNFTRTLAGAIVLFGALGFAQAGVVDPTQPVAGKSQLELSEQWWQWGLGIPASDNPLSDSNGSFAQVNNNGPVFFLAGSLGGTVERTFDVPAGRPLFFPVINNIDVEFPQFVPNCITDPSSSPFAPGATDSVTCALSFISPGLDGASNLHATLDGLNLLTFPSFRQTSTAFFDINLPPAPDHLFNAYGVAGGFYPGISVSDGYWVALDGLSPGQHTLIFDGKYSDGNGVAVTANLNVVPEPGTLSLVLLGAFAAYGRRRG